MESPDAVIFSGVTRRDSSTSFLSSISKRVPSYCVGVVLLLCASMLVLMRPAVQTLSQLAKRDHSLCWLEVLLFFCLNTNNHLAQEEQLFLHPPHYKECSLPLGSQKVLKSIKVHPYIHLYICISFKNQITLSGFNWNLPLFFTSKRGVGGEKACSGVFVLGWTSTENAARYPWCHRRAALTGELIRPQRGSVAERWRGCGFEERQQWGRVGGCNIGGAKRWRNWL